MPCATRLGELPAPRNWRCPKVSAPCFSSPLLADRIFDTPTDAALCISDGGWAAGCDCRRVVDLLADFSATPQLALSAAPRRSPPLLAALYLTYRVEGRSQRANPDADLDES